MPPEYELLAGRPRPADNKLSAHDVVSRFYSKLTSISRCGTTAPSLAWTPLTVASAAAYLRETGRGSGVGGWRGPRAPSAAWRGVHRVLHLHRLEDDEGLARLHRLAGGHEHLDEIRGYAT